MRKRAQIFLCRLSLIALAATTGLAAAAAAQDDGRPELTLEDIFLHEAFEPEKFESARWSESGSVLSYIAESGSGQTSILAYDPEADTVTTVVDGSTLYADDVDRTITVEDFAFSRDGSKVLLYTDSERVWRENTKGYYYVFDIAEEGLRPLSDRELGFQMFAKLDPSGTRAAFVRRQNIFMVDLDSGAETRLTSDGSPGSVINGTSDWVYEEEFGLRDAWRWSPDGRYIAFLQLDETRTRDYWLPDLRGQYPEFKRFRYPKAGETNSEIRVGAINIDSGAITFFDTDTWYAGGEQHEYIPRIGWTPEIDGSHKIWLLRLNRDQNVLDLIYADRETGSTQVVLTETEPTYIDVETGFSDLDVGKISYLDDGERFVWVSETSGYKHLYLHANTGERLRQITSGEWQVANFHGVDQEAGYVYFTGTLDHATQRHLYRIAFGPDTAREAGYDKVTSGRGWHKIKMSPDRKYFIDSYSNLATPLTVTLWRSNGTEVKVLEGNRELKEKLEAYDLPPIELMEASAADGTPLNAYRIRPRDFDPFQTYPLMLYVYGGPGSQRVRNEWQDKRGLWHQYLADTHDLVVVCVDPRGTGGRGKDFQSITYRQLGVIEAQDFISVAQELGGLGYIDRARIGVWGWSYGGFMTLNSMFMGEGPETFKLGVAVAPVTDWRQYDTIYTERYMSTPQKNEEGYRAGSPIHYVDRMSDRQKMLLVHGTADDNVHLQNSIQLVEALQRAGKQFHFMVYPGKTHSISGGETQLHLYTMMTEFIGENL